MKKFELISLLCEWEKLNEHKIIAIDGRCAAGKTTLAKILSENVNCDIIHIDDFFLPVTKRTEERMARSGGNIDFERLISEVLTPIKNGEHYVYSKYNCQNGSFSAGQSVNPQIITVVEGSYSCHPCVFPFYDLHIFLDIDGSTQKERVLRRNKDNADAFFSKWIPMEEKYFSEFNIKDKCEIVLTDWNKKYEKQIY